MAISLFKAYFVGNFCNHSNGEIKISVEILHVSYSSNKLIERNLWKAIFSFWLQRGGQISPLMHVRLSIFGLVYLELFLKKNVDYANVIGF